MTTTINSDGTAPQATKGYTPVGILSSTNTSPISVTFNAAHGFNDGDTIEILGHQTNTNANGLWVFQKTSSTAGTLLGSTGNGVGGATGYAIDYAINPLLTIPEDLVDDVDASTVNPAFEGLFDISPFLYERVGKYRLVDIYQGASATDPPTGGVLSTTTPPTATWTDLTSMTGLLDFSGYPAAPVLKPGDWLEVSFGVSVNLGGTIGAGPWAIGLSCSIGGGAYSVLTTSTRLLTQTASPAPFAVSYLGFGLASHSYGDTFNLGLKGWSANNTTNIVLFGSYQMIAKHYRAN